VFFDLEAGVIEAVHASPIGQLLRLGNLLSHTRGQNWAKDHYKRFEH
jgi:hypothetical protein